MQFFFKKFLEIDKLPSQTLYRDIEYMYFHKNHSSPIILEVYAYKTHKHLNLRFHLIQAEQRHFN